MFAFLYTKSLSTFSVERLFGLSRWLQLNEASCTGPRPPISGEVANSEGSDRLSSNVLDVLLQSPAQRYQVGTGDKRSISETLDATFPCFSPRCEHRCQMDVSTCSRTIRLAQSMAIADCCIAIRRVTNSDRISPLLPAPPFQLPSHSPLFPLRYLWSQCRTDSSVRCKAMACLCQSQLDLRTSIGRCCLFGELRFT